MGCSEVWPRYMIDSNKTVEYHPVHKPSHYNKYGIEALDAIQASMEPIEFQGYLKGNFEKYVWRYRYKGKPLEDLQKAEFYLKRLIDEISKEQQSSKVST